MFVQRLNQLQEALAANNIDVALITDEDNVYYLTGYYDYLHMEFGRPTILVVPQNGKTLLITPTIDRVMAEADAQVDRIAPWNDGAGNEWREELPTAVKGAASVAIEPHHMPPLVRAYVDELLGKETLASVTPLLATIRMIKSAEELQLARHAGQVANAMMAAVAKLSTALEKEDFASTDEHMQFLANDVRGLMDEVRAHADALEGEVADDMWPLPKYREMLFIK